MAKKKPETEDDAVKPQVIDLEAETVIVEPEAAVDEPVPPPPPLVRKKRSTTGYWLLAALLAGAVGGGWLYRDYLSAYLPTSVTADLTNRIAILEAQVKTQNDQLSGVATASSDSQTKAAAAESLARDAASQLQSALENTKSTGERFRKLESDLASARTAIEALQKIPPPSSSGGTAPPDSAALSALTGRVETLEKELASLRSAKASPAAMDTAALSQAAADLKAKFAAGAAYKAELDRVARIVPAAAGLDQLGSYSESGIPDAAGLATELRALIPSLPKPDAGDESAVSEGFWSALGSIVTVRKVGDVDWQAVAASAAILARENKLAESISVIDIAEGAKPAGLMQWRDRAAARLHLEAAAAEFSAAIERQLAAGTQQ
ncbi:MAG: hypothetical protein HC855_11105 [Rhizobiales bacterium]|nr:hypothetical protein [Hyphomicrobiales bacterium]